MRIYIAAIVLGTCLGAVAAEVKPISPAGSVIVGPYTPGLLAGGFLYVSGQGALNAGKQIPPTTAGQIRQCLDNVRAVVEAAGLTMDHVVYAQLYLTDPASYDEALAEWDRYFPNGGPARAVLGVDKLPAGTPVEINAVAVADLAGKKAIRLDAGAKTPDAVIASGRLYFSACVGEAEAALERLGTVLKAAGIGYGHVVFVNPYLNRGTSAEAMNRVYARYFEFGNTPARATIGVSHLPGGAKTAFTGVAVMDLAARRAVRPKNMPPSPTASPCVLAGDTLFCSAKSGFIPGPKQGIYADTVENQTRQTMRNLLDGLEEAGMTFSNTVATNVYLDDIADFPKMNRIYAMYFAQPHPTRTTVAQLPPAERKANDREQWPTLEQISLIAVK